MNSHNFIANIANRLLNRPNTLGIHMGEVLQGASVAFILKVVGTLLAFFFNFLLARFLSAEGAGVYYLALTVTTIASLLGKMGLENALLRYTAANAAIGRWGRVKGLYLEGMGLAGSISIAATLVILILAPWLSRAVFNEPELIVPLRIMALSIVPFGLLTLHSALLKGLKKIRDATIVRALAIPLVNIPLLAILSGPLGTRGAALSYTVATVVVLLFAARAWRAAVPQLKSARRMLNTRQLVSTSLPLLWIDALNYTISSAGILLLGVWLDSEAVGIYAIALRTTLLMRFVLDATNSIVAPKIAALYQQDSLQELSDMIRKVSLLLAGLGVPTLVPFLIVPRWILSFFGSDFAGGSAALVILAIGQYVNVATGSVGYLLLMTGHEKAMRNNFAFNAVLNVTLNVVLIPRIGLVGAAVAGAATLTIINLLNVYLVHKHLSIKVWSMA